MARQRGDDVGRAAAGRRCRNVRRKAATEMLASTRSSWPAAAIPACSSHDASSATGTGVAVERRAARSPKTETSRHPGARPLLADLIKQPAGPDTTGASSIGAPAPSSRRRRRRRACSGRRAQRRRHRQTTGIDQRPREGECPARAGTALRNRRDTALQRDEIGRARRVEVLVGGKRARRCSCRAASPARRPRRRQRASRPGCRRPGCRSWRHVHRTADLVRRIAGEQHARPWRNWPCAGTGRCRR